MPLMANATLPTRENGGQESSVELEEMRQWKTKRVLCTTCSCYRTRYQNPDTGNWGGETCPKCGSTSTHLRYTPTGREAKAS